VIEDEGAANEFGRPDYGQGRERQSPLRRSSKSKLNLEQAKELDGALNQKPNLGFQNQRDSNVDNHDKVGPKASPADGGGGFL